MARTTLRDLTKILSPRERTAVTGGFGAFASRITRIRVGDELPSGIRVGDELPSGIRT